MLRSCRPSPTDSSPTSCGSSSSPCCHHAHPTITAGGPARSATEPASPRSCSWAAPPPRGSCCPLVSWAAAATRPPTAGSAPGQGRGVRPAQPAVARPARRGRPDRLAPGQRRLGQPAGGEKGEHTGPNPTDRGKAGSKLHLAADGGGIPLAVVLTGANTNDSVMFEL